MNQLKVISHNGQLVTESREVAKMTDKRHADLIRDIENYKSVLDQNAKLRSDQNSKMSSDDFFIETSYQAGTGRNYKCFLLTRKGCNMVANKMTGEKGVLFTAEYVTRFEEMEQKLQQPNDLVTNYLSMSEEDRAIAFFNSQKEKKQIEQQRQEELPYTNFGKAVSNSSAAINIGAFSKLMYDKYGIKLGRNKMFQWLRDNGFLIKSGRERNQPKQQFIEQGLFTTTVTMVSRTEGDVESVTTLITGKGQIKLSNKLISEFSTLNQRGVI